MARAESPASWATAMAESGDVHRRRIGRDGRGEELQELRGGS